jgi:hypothetical protein
VLHGAASRLLDNSPTENNGWCCIKVARMQRSSEFRLSPSPCPSSRCFGCAYERPAVVEKLNRTIALDAEIDPCPDHDHIGTQPLIGHGRS